MLGHHLNLEKSYFDSNNPRSIHTALAEYLKMQDALTQFISSRVEHENGALKEHVTEIQDFRENCKVEQDGSWTYKATTLEGA